MSSSKIAAGVYLSEAQNLIPPLIHCIYVYAVYLFTKGQGEGERVEPERRLEGQQFTMLGQKYQHDRVYLRSTNFDKHLPQSPYTGEFF
jgi:hypothetical protein